MLKLRFAFACLLMVAPIVSFAQRKELTTGVTLPHAGNIFALDADSQLKPLHSSEVVSNGHTAGNLARAQVFAGSHSTVEIDKVTSSVVLRSSPTAIFVRVGNGDESDRMRSQLTLIRLKPTKERRVALEMKQNVFGGHRTRNVDEVATTKADAEEEGVVKMTPQAPLAPGEYGVVFMPKDPMFFADSVYDFTVGGK